MGNLRGTGPHMFRHMFCSHLAMRGAAPKAIQELAGHRDLGTTLRCSRRKVLEKYWRRLIPRSERWMVEQLSRLRRGLSGNPRCP